MIEILSPLWEMKGGFAPTLDGTEDALDTISLSCRKCWV